MSYIGNPIVSTDFPVDYASGNGSTTAFTLSIAPASVNAIDVEVSGVTQSPQTYTLSGTTLTFSAAPPSGTNNIVVKHRGVAGTPNVPAVGSVTSSSLAAQDLSINGVTVGKGGGSVSTNTAVGYQSAYSNTTGSNYVAVGYQAGYSNTTGRFNNSFGTQALYSVTIGERNNAFGYRALYSNTGENNTAMGDQALQANTTANNNTAVGYQAGYSNTIGTNNVYIGQGAGYANTNSDGNTLIGQNAGKAVNTNGANICIGREAGNFLTTGYYNTIIGSYGGGGSPGMTATSNNFVVIADGSGAPRIWFDNGGIPSMSNLYSHTTSASANVYVDGNLTLYRSTSSIKYKTNVQDTTHGLAEVLKLRPVTYSGIADNDSDLTLGGLIAEEVHEAGLTEFVQYAEDGTPDALAYGQMVSLAFKAIQELKAEVDTLKITVETQATEIAALKGVN